MIPGKRHLICGTIVWFVLTGSALSQCTFTLDPDSAQVSAGATTGSFGVNASASTCPRSATSNASWLTVTFGQTGSGNGSVGYRADTNSTYATRTGTITVGNAVFSLSQTGAPCPAASFSPLGQTVQPAGGTFGIAVTSPCAWTASTTAAWITLSANSGSSSGSLFYTVAPNNTGAARSGTIQIGVGQYSVTQSSVNCTFTVSPLAPNIPAAGGQNQISVQTSNTGCLWAVLYTASWISNVTIGGKAATSATGSGSFSYTVAANTAIQPRTATIAVADQTVTVTQLGNVCTLTMTPASASVSGAANTGSFAVAATLSSCPWTATSNNTWISLTSGASGNAAGNVGYAIGANTSIQPRTGSIAVATNAATSMFNVSQDACQGLSVTPQSQSVPAAGGNFSIGITTSCTWTASVAATSTVPAASWIALNAGSGTTGNGSLSYTVAPNNTASSRSGIIMINQQAFTVTQSGINSAGSGIQFTAQSMVNAASFANGPIAPGELVSIFGTGLGPAQPVGLQVTPDGKSVTTSLGGTQVLFDGRAAPLTYASATQVNAIVPFELAGASSTQVVVEVQGVGSNPAAATMAPSSPAIFAIAGGIGQGAILNQDSSPNSVSNPAAPGSVLQVFMTGAGQTNPGGVDGQIAGASASSPMLNVTATVGGMPASVQYAGSSNGLVAGVTQVNVAIPANVQTGDQVPVVISIGGKSSGAGVTAAIH